MTLSEFCLLLASVFTSVGGQFFLKSGANTLGKVITDNTISHIIRILTIPELIAGLVCYALGALSYILLLTRVSLSIASPATSLVYLFSVLIGYLVFKETIPITRLIGLSLIMFGVILVIWKN